MFRVRDELCGSSMIGDKKLCTQHLHICNKLLSDLSARIPDIFSALNSGCTTCSRLKNEVSVLNAYVLRIEESRQASPKMNEVRIDGTGLTSTRKKKLKKKIRYAIQSGTLDIISREALQSVLQYSGVEVSSFTTTGGVLIIVMKDLECQICFEKMSMHSVKCNVCIECNICADCEKLIDECPFCRTIFT